LGGGAWLSFCAANCTHTTAASATLQATVRTHFGQNRGKNFTRTGQTSPVENNTTPG